MIRMSMPFLLGIMSVSSATAEVYKWKDQNGKVQYGDVPTSNKVKKIDIRPAMKGTAKPGSKCPYVKD